MENIENNQEVLLDEEKEQEEVEEESQEESEDKEQIDWKAEALKNKAILERLKKKSEKKEEPKKEVNNNDAILAELNSMKLSQAGVKEKEDKDFMLRYAKANDLTIDEVLESEEALAVLATKKQKRAEQNSSLAPNNRTGDKGGDATLRRALNHYNSTGEIMNGLDIVTTNKLFNHIKNNQK